MKSEKIKVKMKVQTTVDGKPVKPGEFAMCKIEMLEKWIKRRICFPPEEIEGAEQPEFTGPESANQTPDENWEPKKIKVWLKENAPDVTFAPNTPKEKLLDLVLDALTKEEENAN